MRNPSDLPDADEPRLPDALAERLRTAASPDPGDAYFDALPARVRARLAVGAASLPVGRSVGEIGRPARAPEHRARPLRAARLVAVASVLAAMLLVVVQIQRPTAPLGSSASEPLAQTRPSPPARPTPDSLPPAVHAPDGPVVLPRGGTPGKSTPGDRVRRARERRPAGPAVPGASTSSPVRTQRLASAAPGARAQNSPVPSAAPRLVPVSTADSDGHRLLQQAQMVVLAVQNADTGADVAVLQPLAAHLAAELTRWRASAPLDSDVRALVDLVEPVVLGVATLDPSDADTARLLVAAAQRADLTLQLDRALLVAGSLPSLVY